MSEGLKPCPFCGGAAEEMKAERGWQTDAHTWCAYCLRCGVKTDWEHAGEHIKAWNLRVENKFQAEVITLRADNAMLNADVRELRVEKDRLEHELRALRK